MRLIRSASFALALATGFGGVAQAQTVGYNLRTGDVWLDSRLGEVNDYGTRYREPFITEINQYYGAPRSLLVDLLDRRNWSPGDIYYACAIARARNLPCADIVRDYDADRGQGWGAIAKRHGIKPGSAVFHALKRGTVATYDRWGYPISLTDTSRVDWSKGKVDKGQGKGSAAKRGGPTHSPSRSVEYARGKPNADPDKGGKDKSGHGKDTGKGNGKGNGKGG